MKEENVLVIWAIWSIAMAAMGLLMYAVFKSLDNDAVMTALIMLPSNALAGLIGYLTKSLSGKNVNNGGNNETT